MPDGKVWSSINFQGAIMQIYMIVSTQITNTEIFNFNSIQVVKLLSRDASFMNRKGNRNYEKVGYFVRKLRISRVDYCRTIYSWNAKFSGYF